MACNKRNKRGILITFEGIDGCGKTTAMHGAAEILSKEYKKIVTFRDPGTTKVSEAIRNILLEPNLNMSVWTEYYLYVAARAELVKKIEPYLEQGAIVFLDRFYDSTIAYQGFRNGIPLQFILEDNKRIGCPEPDLTLLYKLGPEVGMQRNISEGKQNRIDQESLDKHKKVYEGYEWVAKKFKNRVRIIDASQSKEKVLEETVMIIDEFLSQ
ncbi:MAG: dTMP kinase [Candidatus Pacearchaeota archaeon]|nr:dTMP kinase [Candidatus Pacearchaeota archaeon]